MKPNRDRAEEQNSVGNILDHVEDDSAVYHMSSYTAEHKSDYFKTAIRQYIEKCRHLEVELIKKEHVSN